MSILCKLFGHQPPTCAEKGWWSPGEEYATLKSHGVDGIGRKHGVVYSTCPRCEKEILLCRVHIPEEKE